MDLADEIAYAAHDLDDALKLKYFTIGELLYEFEKSDFKKGYQELAKFVEQARTFAKQSSTYNSSEEYSILFRKELTSIIVNALIMDIGLLNSKNENYELGYSSLPDIAKGLKKLTFKSVKRNPEVIEYELTGKHILNSLFQLYMDKKFNRDLVLLPAEYREQENWERTVVDYLGGMMDSYALAQYEKYFGKLKDKGIYNLNNRIA